MQFFKWVDKHHDVTSGTSGSLSNTLCPKINDSQQIMEYFRSSSLSLFCHCQYIRRSEDCKQKQRVFVSSSSSCSSSCCRSSCCSSSSSSRSVISV